MYCCVLVAYRCVLLRFGFAERVDNPESVSKNTVVFHCFALCFISVSVVYRVVFCQGLCFGATKVSTDASTGDEGGGC